MLETQRDKPAVARRLDLRLYIRQQPVMLALLAVLAVISFAAVSGLSRAYHAQRAALGNRWFSRGVADLNARHFDSAVTEFRAALLYAPDNYDYQLNLAEALIGLKRTGEAYSYLANLWDQQPEHGQVNLELARIAAQRGQTGQALRYYHNAIYAVWPGDPEEKRRDTRLELIEYLLSIHAQAEGQAELIALEENLGDDPSQQQRVGDLFLRAQDYEHALGAYHISLKSDPHRERAMAGAGLAAFELGRYPLAEHRLQEAVAGNPDDTPSADLLKTTEQVLQMDPFRRPLSVAHRDEIVVQAFRIAGERLKSCGIRASATPAPGAQPTLADRWAKLKPQVSEQYLRREPDLVEQAMDLVFSIERQTSTTQSSTTQTGPSQTRPTPTGATCGTPTGADLALLLIAKLHEGT
jgi:tetratricopeptide (TPR) repeat protein